MSEHCLIFSRCLHLSVSPALFSGETLMLGVEHQYDNRCAGNTNNIDHQQTVKKCSNVHQHNSLVSSTDRDQSS